MYERVQVSFGFSEEKFLSGSHVCYIFGEHDERLLVMARYFEAGRRGRERLSYVADRETPAELRRALAERGFSGAESPDFDVQPSSNFYFPDGSFSDDRVLTSIQQNYEAAVAAGCSGLRGSGEMSWAARNVAGREEVLRYESRLTSMLAVYPATVICQYDARLFSGATIMDVLSVHPYMIVHGQLVRNPYFIDPRDFLERYHEFRP